MPCESCNIQFSVFKRKKSCSECRRLYCSNCLTKIKERLMCERCMVFTTRPLSRIELSKLKAKDLIFYLQSKHISTTGCVEKEELVNLVLIHGSNYSPDSQSSGRRQSNDDRSNPFDQIKNTCQNLFSTITEKIAADLNFDMKQTQGGPQQNIFAQQPRRSSNFQPTAPPSMNQHAYHQQRYPSSPPGQPQQSTASTILSNQQRQQQQSNERGSTSSSNGPTSPDQNSAQSSTGSSTMGSQHRKEWAKSTVKPNTSSSQFASDNTGDGKKTKARHINTNGASAASVMQLEVNNICELSSSCSGCECSDDEIITNFQARFNSNANVTKKAKCDDQEAGPSGSTSSSTKTAPNSRSANKTGENSDDSSDVSSFEDLGASAIPSKESNGAPIDAETWHIINRTTPTAPADVSSTSTSQPIASTEPICVISDAEVSSAADKTAPSSPIADQESMGAASPVVPRPLPEIKCTLVADEVTSPWQPLDQTFQAHSSTEPSPMQRQRTTKPKFKPVRQVSRRRSDGIVYQTSSGSTRYNLLDDVDDDDDDDVAETDELDETDESLCEKSRGKRVKKSCHKCGKTKGDIRKHIERFRRQLETTTASEAEIKKQLQEFLSFLESRSRNSIDDGIDQTNDATTPIDCLDNLPDGMAFVQLDDDNYRLDDDTGIHVYGSNDENLSSHHQPRQFINIHDFETSESLEDLTVKQLKEILMLNRIDFKGCCEKGELLERVQRLWKDLQTSPAVEKLSADDLCKICMDAPIECVLLECGHMATCTGCGKVLSECPICRQYIVRVVRFFKA